MLLRKAGLLVLAVLISTVLFLNKASSETAAGSGESVSQGVDVGLFAEIVNNAGENVGKATFKKGPRGFIVDVSVHGLPPGKHGLHVHTVGTCEDMAEFKMAGGHMDMKGKQHGLLNADGPHDGDLPNIFVHSDGTGEAEFYTEGFSMDDLLDKDGSSFMIHAGEDDYMSQPAGNAGARIACGVIGTHALVSVDDSAAQK
jgi:Cu-Zn family superoxide dismutase